MHRVSVSSPTPITCTGEGNHFSVILTLKQIDIVSGDAVAAEKKKETVNCHRCLYSIVLLLCNTSIHNPSRLIPEEVAGGRELISAFICQEAEGFLVGLQVHLRTGPQCILYEKALKNKKVFFWQFNCHKTQLLSIFL